MLQSLLSLNKSLPSPNLHHKINISSFSSGSGTSKTDSCPLFSFSSPPPISAVKNRNAQPKAKTDENTSLAANDEEFSRKVFVGGLPLDITQKEVEHAFEKFGPLEIQWPNKVGNRMTPRGATPSGPGYAFLVFVLSRSVSRLLKECRHQQTEAGLRYFYAVSSRAQRNKVIQVRPWRHDDAEYRTKRPNAMVDPRWTIFIGGLPRPTRAVDLYNALTPHFGEIVYIGIDVDSELRYPKGAARIAFGQYQSLVATMAVRFLNIPDGDGGQKRVELKPYTIGDQPCDQCDGKMCGGQNAKYYCANAGCLQYFCEPCWNQLHHGPGLWKYAQRGLHTPFVRMGDCLVNGPA